MALPEQQHIVDQPTSAAIFLVVAPWPWSHGAVGVREFGTYFIGYASAQT